MGGNRISFLPSECCGCGLCAHVCPTGAISMDRDHLGFPLPSIDGAKCVDCGLCQLKCPFLNAEKWILKSGQTAYAAALKDQEVLARSASGGVFAGLAIAVLQRGGLVFGAAWQQDFSVAHVAVSSVDDLPKLQQSKYTQSSIRSCFSPIKEAIAADKMILFSGTPCQVAAIKSFLGCNPPNFLTLDLVCHGVGSPALLLSDIAALEAQFGKPVDGLSFRSKRNGWGTSGDLVFRDGSIRDFSPLVSPFYGYYLAGCLFRDSCHSCPFAQPCRVGDFTAGDYWGFQKAHPKASIDSRRGVSAFLVNSEKGRSFFAAIRNSFSLCPSTPAKVAARNAQLSAPSPKPSKRARLFALYSNGGYPAIVRFWKRDAFLSRLKLRLKRALPGALKNWLVRLR